MKGLLLKDWYLSVKYARTLLLVSVVFLVLSPFAGDNWFFRLYPSIMIGMLPSTLYSYDEREKWTEYVQSMPVSRALYVTEKYVYGALTIAAYLAVMTILHLIFGTGSLVASLEISLSIGLVAPALLLPLLFKFGAEKGRIAYLVLMGGLFAATLILTNSAGEASLNPGFRFAGLPVWLLFAAVAVIYVLSWRLSVALYQKREL
ncbi:MAG: ABC-2 transporter permease [Ruminococcaceae bacterium]|nr:ABC-2 transporter permease [Oscillospiraceae bacterium]